MSEPKDYILDLNPYQPSLPLAHVARKHNIKPDDIVQLASNENPLGPSPKAIKAVSQILPNTSRYPDQYDLIQSIADYAGASPEQVALGNGSNDILDIIARIYLGEGDESVSSRHSFAVYQIATRTAGATNIVVGANQDYSPDLKAMLDAVTANTKVVWLDNPGNPTGAFTPYYKVLWLLNKLPRKVVLVLDEAYFEYLPEEAKESAVEWLADHPNLIIVRTFSKMYGLAGMRIGYAISSPKIIELMNRVRHPFNANVPAMVAARAALHDQDFVQRSRELNHQGREQLTLAFDKLGLDYIRPYGNFVTVRLPNATSVYQKLLAKGIIVRPLVGYGMPEYLRVTVGTFAENHSFIDALNEILS